MKPKMTATEAADFLGVTAQALHKQLRTKDLPFEKSQNRVYFGHETSRALFNHSFRQTTVATQIVKGGTGKTSLVFALAARANLYGARVLCVDMDQQGNLTDTFNVVPEDIPCMVDIINDGLPVDDAIVNILPGLDLFPSRIENVVLDNVLMLKRFPLDRVYRDRFDPLRDRYDLILFDCPPALGQSVAATALASDLILAPVTPERYALSGLKITANELKNIESNYDCRIPMRILLNRFDNRTSLSHDTLSYLLKHPAYGDMLSRSYIRTSQDFPNASAKGLSIYDTLRATPAKEDIDLLTRELLGIGDESTAVRQAS